MIHKADKELKATWLKRFDSLPIESKRALKGILIELRTDALAKAEYSWRKHKGPMALYWKVVGVYAGHLSRAIKVSPKQHRLSYRTSSDITVNWISPDEAEMINSAGDTFTFDPLTNNGEELTDFLMRHEEAKTKNHSPNNSPL